MKKKKYTCSCEYHYIRELLQKFTTDVKKVLNIIVNFGKIPAAVPRTLPPWGLDENFFCLTEVLGVDGLNVPLEKLLKLDN